MANKIYMSPIVKPIYNDEQTAHSYYIKYVNKNKKSVILNLNEYISIIKYHNINIPSNIEEIVKIGNNLLQTNLCHVL
jgi:hypothetical protein